MSLDLGRSPAAQCFHKSVIGCCLTATTGCCACVDTRPLASAYEIYVDGEGLRLRGSRWEGYCWKCKSEHLPNLWTVVTRNHYNALTLTTSLLGYWNCVLGHNPQSPQSAYYPPALRNPLQHRQSLSTETPSQRISRLRTELHGVQSGMERIATGLQDTGADLRFSTMHPDMYSLDQNPAHDQNLPMNPTITTSPSRYTQNQIDGHARNRHTVHSAHGLMDQNDLRARQRAYLDGTGQRWLAHPSLDSRASSIQTATSPPVHPSIPYSALGTREDVESPDYQSPIGLMMNRAWDRYHSAENSRRQNPFTTPAQVQSPDSAPPAVPRTGHGYYGPSLYPGASPFYGGLPGGAHAGLLPNPFSTEPTMARDVIAQHTIESRRRRAMQAAHEQDIYQRLNRGYQADANARARLRRAARANVHAHPPTSSDHLDDMEFFTSDEEDDKTKITFDTQKRPPPLSPDQMMKDLSCTVCKEHLIGTVLLPCGHAVMCEWCADLQIPTKAGGIHPSKRDSCKCPICRSRVTEKVKKQTSCRHAVLTLYSARSFTRNHKPFMII